MPFKPFDPEESSRRRARLRQGEPRLTVSQSPAGRTKINISAAVRDCLGPTPVPAGRGRTEWTMRVRLLVDAEAQQVAIQRASDDADPRTTYEVSGLNSGSAYILDWNLDEVIGLRAGSYPAVLGNRAAIIDLKDWVEPALRKRLDKFEQQRAVIEEILNEGITEV